MDAIDLKEFLDSKVEQYNRPEFIAGDPISIPHLFTKLQDIEISGLWTAILSWGQRKTIINKSRELFGYMDNRPYDFVLDHSESDLKALMKFKHRTFNDVDTLYFISFFKWFYSTNDSLENLFYIDKKNGEIEDSLNQFHDQFCSLPHFPIRTRKHISSPMRNSACKRINMFLRWMVRKDSHGVDFGLWKRMAPSKLICPCDLHVERVARKLNLIRRRQTDWKMALELTTALRTFDPIDPVKYDFALFGLGIEEKFWN